MHLEIKAENDQHFDVIALIGRLDNLTAAEFADFAKREFSSGARRVLIDASGLEYVSSAGIAELLVAGKELAASGGSLEFAGLKKPVQSVFEIVGFPKLFRIHASRQSANAEAGE